MAESHIGAPSRNGAPSHAGASSRSGASRGRRAGRLLGIGLGVVLAGTALTACAEEAEAGQRCVNTGTMLVVEDRHCPSGDASATVEIAGAEATVRWYCGGEGEEVGQTAQDGDWGRCNSSNSSGGSGGGSGDGDDDDDDDRHSSSGGSGGRGRH
ncbi:hypothetical protein [Allostreptomyces psammosilenae]|uniref:Uncharacterized protein n=1 Tax=Allostreptomyces psammosilenae TaxID=1892865 RepID=A0A852ZZ43_9ACTN|nr:hypothetical protein [Allostreptomyces psammosilenae]NYI07345.1 hypothetical protein [Allostreptomyces psammosilenae]